MKGRSSHRLPVTEPEDWGDGSWTVDCVCGVNFDDGEEMVSCDECGVWVHTRCSHFVKGESSFTCDKCKSKTNRNEEREVAQLLAELPTKTMRMDPQFAARRQFRLWTDIPVEQRVHVQGIPGGEPGLFNGLSSVFTSELWKCTGYVPKKFNFKYAEFPSWDEKSAPPAFGSLLVGEECGVVDPKLDKDAHNSLNIGAADVLFSLSKEIGCNSLEHEKFGNRKVSWMEERERDKQFLPRMMRNNEGKGFVGKTMQNDRKNVRSQLGIQGVQVSKRKNDEGGKDHSIKKKTKIVMKEGLGDNKKRLGSHDRNCYTGFESAIGTNKLEGHEDSSSNGNGANNPRGLKMESKRINVFFGCNPGIQKEPRTNSNKRKRFPLDKDLYDSMNVASECTSSPKKNVLDDVKPQVHPSVGVATAFDANEGNAKREVAPNSQGLHPVGETLKLKKADEKEDIDLNLNCESFTLPVTKKLSPLRHEMENTVVAISDRLISKETNMGPACKSEIRMDADTLIQEATSIVRKSDLSSDKEELDSSSLKGASQTMKENNVTVKPVNEQQENPDNCTAASSPVVTLAPSDDTHVGRDSASENQKVSQGVQSMREQYDLPEASSWKESSSKSMPRVKHPFSSTKIAGSKSKSLLPGIYKTPAAGKVSGSTLQAAASSKAIPSSNVIDPLQLVASVSQPQAKHHPAKLPGNLSATDDSKKVDVQSGGLSDDSKSTSVSSGKDKANIRMNLGTKVTHTESDLPAPSSKNSQPKKTKEEIVSPPSQASPSNASQCPSRSDEGTVAVSEVISSPHTGTDASHEIQKATQPSLLPTNKVVESLPPLHPLVSVSSSVRMSDEELALMLHHELNSSPRVPRVSRLRNAGTTGQMASAGSPFGSNLRRSSTATTPSSSLGQKEHSGSRRKRKDDMMRDNSKKQVEETKRIGKIASPDHRQDDSLSRTDFAGRGGNNKTSDGRDHTKKSSRTPSAHGSPSPSYESGVPNVTELPREFSASDYQSHPVATKQKTLPGLINEILSKNKDLSTEEICNAVLPYWQNLRKHNGEKYAYSNHVHAVLDCLRNRNSWAQLVDRGPKTSTGKKKRKMESDATNVDSEPENDHQKEVKSRNENGEGREEGPDDDVPKGKRNVRRRRRLALQGKTIRKRGGKKRRKAMSMDDDFEELSASSDGSGSIFSDDESEGVPHGTSGSKLSSSDESESMEG